MNEQQITKKGDGMQVGARETAVKREKPFLFLSPFLVGISPFGCLISAERMLSTDLR